MRRVWLVGLAMAAAVVFLPNRASAQVRSDAARSAETMKSEGGGWGQVYEKIRPVYLKRLEEELHLDQDTIKKMEASFEQQKEQSQELYKERRALVAKLQEALERDAADQEITAILDEYSDNYDRSHRLRYSRQAEVRQILGDRGYAKYVIFQRKFRQEIRDIIRELKKKG